MPVKKRFYNTSVVNIASIILPWMASLMLVVLFAFTMLYLQKTPTQNEEKLTVRRVDLAVPPPPPAPPVEMQTPRSDSPTPSIDLMGATGGAAMHFTDKPKLSMNHLEAVEKPDFKMNAIDFNKSLSFEFPTVEVQELDETPHAVSTVAVKYPSSISRRGIKRVPTTVELIIDQRGKAYIKKIVDPVYPEMIQPIRKWVENVQFTVPTKNGRPIQAVYLYTLIFVYRI